MVTEQEINEVAEKTGLEVEEVLSKLRSALMRNAAYVKITGPKANLRIDLFSVKASPEEGARRLIREFDLCIGHGGLKRIWRKRGLLETRQRKYQRKQDIAQHQSLLGPIPANPSGYQGSR